MPAVWHVDSESTSEGSSSSAPAGTSKKLQCKRVLEAGLVACTSCCILRGTATTKAWRSCKG